MSKRIKLIYFLSETLEKKNRLNTRECVQTQTKEKVECADLKKEQKDPFDPQVKSNQLKLQNAKRPLIFYGI